MILAIGASIACSGSDSNGPTGAAGSAASGSNASCRDIPASRGASESCCPDYGLDACGAGLVCAALDGRTIATCYLEKSRKALESCTVDALCASGDCNEMAGRCKSITGEACDAAVGCLPLNGTNQHPVCVAPLISPPKGADLSRRECGETPATGACSYCTSDADCNDNAGYKCLGNRCLGGHGASMITEDCCAYGTASCGGSDFVYCSCL